MSYYKRISQLTKKNTQRDDVQEANGKLFKGCRKIIQGIPPGLEG
jgi:hypothetical protein